MGSQFLGRCLAPATTGLAVMVIVAGLLGCHRRPTVTIPIDPAIASALRVPAPMHEAAAKLIRQCHTDPTSADKYYRGRRLSVSGVVLQIAGDELRLGPTPSTVVPGVPATSYVSCHGPSWPSADAGKGADKADTPGKASANEAKTGAAITIEGTFKTCLPDGVAVLVDCKVFAKFQR